VTTEYRAREGKIGAGASQQAGPGFFHAVAIDFDGTLTDAGLPQPGTLAALDEARASGMRLVIVTGRILNDLLDVFADAGLHVDLIVAENGAVLAQGGRHRELAEPVPAELATALAGRGVSCRRGQVLLACRGADEPVVHEEIRRLGLECQLIRNRAELMVLPAGISKGTGLTAGLAELGISAHNAAAIGDAENDRSLLAAAELGVAVGNAVSALKADADITLADEDGVAVASFLRGPVIAGRERVPPPRWRVTLGALADGTPVSVPASQVNMLITGIPQRGKSYVAGLIAERLIRLGASHVREMRAQVAGGLASEVRARRRRSRDRAVALAVGAGCDDPKAARLAAAAINVLTSAEISLGMIDRFGIEGDDLIRTHAWISRTLVEAIKRGDLPAPAENIHS